MYYVVAHGEKLDTASEISTSSFYAAQHAAEHLFKETGKHHHVIEVETKWTTKTLADLKAEGAL